MCLKRLLLVGRRGVLSLTSFVGALFKGLNAQPKESIVQDLSETIEKRKAAVLIIRELTKQKRDGIIAIFSLFLCAAMGIVFGNTGAMGVALFACAWFMFRIFMIATEGNQLSAKYKLVFTPDNKPVDVSNAPVLDVK